MGTRNEGRGQAMARQLSEAAWAVHCQAAAARAAGHQRGSCGVRRKTVEEISKKALEIEGNRTYLSPAQHSHVPVAACWSVDIRTRGRTVARDKGSLSGDGYP